eukprot:TRINITY_DN1326_c0_g1_i1.p1 TRINITY_DN1326_c0_g1~~TRINITY_DN1326_c0_g1_i1.p1  ORF type:complete len:442 (-),score=-31.12 TRINITY_DN1326_c0_g1_i1:217-1542(-)
MFAFVVVTMLLAPLLGLLGVDGVKLDPVQHAALMEVYDAALTCTTSCTRFGVDEDCPSHYTIACDNGNVTKLFLIDSGIQSLPAAIVKLSALTYLQLGDNQLTTIPSQVGLLTSLEVLAAYSNQLATIPSQVGLMTSLEELFVHRNQLSTIPTQVGLMTSLINLSVGENRLTAIPSQVGQLTRLTKLSMHDNAIDGTIATQFGRITNLERLWLYSNNFVGDIPDGLRASSNCRIQGQYDDYTESNCFTSCPDGCCTSSSFCSDPSQAPCKPPYECYTRDPILLTCTVPKCSETIPCSTRVAGWNGRVCEVWAEETPVSCSDGVCGSTSDFSRCNGARSELALCADETCRKSNSCQAGSTITSSNTTSEICFVNGEQRDCGDWFYCDSDGGCVVAPTTCEFFSDMCAYSNTLIYQTPSPTPSRTRSPSTTISHLIFHSNDSS